MKRKNSYAIIKLNLVFLFFLFHNYLPAQNYTWVKGPNIAGQSGVYGTMGTPAPANNPGARFAPTNWQDGSGNFWLFGGEGYATSAVDDQLNDLWRYNPGTNMWTWINGSNLLNQSGVYGTMGVPSSLNKPGARSGAVSWVDASGNLWMFGGSGYDAFGTMGSLSDLWKYSISNNQWTWIKGSNLADMSGVYGSIGVPANGNLPGGRGACGTWTDAAGNLWLFGGLGIDGAGNYGDLGDMWKYSILNNQWTWVKGYNAVDQNGVYGALGIPSNANMPGSRYYPTFWSDGSGNFYMDGGAGFDAGNTFEDYLNDLWRYNITSNQWTWVRGSNSSGQSGTYGTQGTGSPLNEPGARFGATPWTDATGNFFLFGGWGIDSSTGDDFLNDLWKYNVTSNTWTWMKGSNFVSASGNYGTIGISSPINTPGARVAAAGWADPTGSLWLFGGFGYDFSGNDDNLSDLWKIGGCVNPPLITVVSSTNATCVGGTVSLAATGGVTYNWSTNQTGSSIVVAPAASGLTVYTSFGTDANGCVGSTTIALNALALPNVTATSNRGAICIGADQAILTASGANTYSWNTVPASISASVVVSPTISTIYMVSGTDLNGCTKTFSITQIAVVCLGIEAGINYATPFIMYPNPNSGAFKISGDGLEQGGKILIFNTLGQEVFHQNLSGSENNIHTQLPTGIYHYSVQKEEMTLGSGKIIIE